MQRALGAVRLAINQGDRFGEAQEIKPIPGRTPLQGLQSDLKAAWEKVGTDHHESSQSVVSDGAIQEA